MKTNIFKKMHNSFLDILFPKGIKCTICGRDLNKDESSRFICEKCYHKIPRFTGKCCIKCGEPLYSDAKFCKRCLSSHFTFEKAFCVGEYTGILRNALMRFKFGGNAYLSSTFASLMYDEYVLSISPFYKLDAIIYMPMEKESEKQRQYNQAKLLADDFSSLSGIEVLDNVVVKVKKTKRQIDVDFVSRKTNLNKAFKVINKKSILNKTILFIDDIFTTGSSAEEISSLLVSSGAYKVIVLTVAHTKIKKHIGGN